MKTFKDYITKRTFDFRIKVAGELPAKFESVLKTSLEKFGVASMTISKTPIQKLPLDFPGVDNAEVHIYEVCLNYPVIPPVLRSYVMEKTGVPEAKIVVRNVRDNEEEYQEYGDSTQKSEKYVTKLTSEYETDAKMDKMAQEMVGEKRAFDLLKELSKKEKD
jgi:NhaP-type Na+/H+ and K+/H+ antiporter